jgi:hypothetical protein
MRRRTALFRYLHPVMTQISDCAARCYVLLTVFVFSRSVDAEASVFCRFVRQVLCANPSNATYWRELSHKVEFPDGIGIELGVALVDTYTAEDRSAGQLRFLKKAKSMGGFLFAQSNAEILIWRRLETSETKTGLYEGTESSDLRVHSKADFPRLICSGTNLNTFGPSTQPSLPLPTLVPSEVPALAGAPHRRLKSHQVLRVDRYFGQRFDSRAVLAQSVLDDTKIEARYHYVIPVISDPAQRYVEHRDNLLA